MTAEIIILADYRSRRTTLRWTFDPMMLWRAWFGFWLGRRTVAGAGVVRALAR